MITKTEILYAFSRLQEQDDLPENVNEFMRDTALSKLAGEELKEGGGMRWRVRNDKPKSDGYYFIKEGDSGGGRYYFETIGGGQWRWHEYSGPVGERHQFEWLDEYAAQFAGTREEIAQLKAKIAEMANDYNSLYDQAKVWKEEAGL